MFAPLPDRLRPATHVAFRLAASAIYFTHGTQKLLGWFGGFDGKGNAAELMTKWGTAGAIETVLGICLLLGFATRLAAFLASGEMSVAYFMIHSGGGSIFWWQNGGELVMLLSFSFLALAAWGSGPFSVDAALARRNGDAPA